MKHFKRALGILALIVVIGVASVTIWQWDNIHAFYVAVTNDTESIGKKLEETRKKNEQTLQEYHIDVTAPSLEQTEALLYGQLTPEEVKESLSLNSIIEESENTTNTTESSNSGSTDAENTQSSEEEAIRLVNACTAELYACQVDLMADLGALYSDTQARWIALGDGRNATTKQQFIAEGLQQCSAIEASTDAMVQGILDKYRAELDAIDADDSALDQLWNIYTEEKNSQKAYYLSQYMN